jgi:hypothetical protein
MPTPLHRHIAVLLCVAVACGLAGSAAAGAEATAPTVAIDNACLRVQWRTEDSTFTVTHKATGRTFVAAGTFGRPKGTVRVTGLRGDALGPGTAIEMAHPDGSTDRLILYPHDVPFLFIQTVLANGGSETQNVRDHALADLRLDLARPPAEVKALGTAGLTAPDGHPGSYCFLVLADPKTRAGVVGAYLTHDRGTGVVFSSVEDGAVRLAPKIEYGRLLVGPGKTAASETFALGWFDDARLGLEQWAHMVALWYGIHLPPQPDGYCTWYSNPHGGASDAKHLAELADFAAKELAPYGFDFIQIDDKWQDGKRRNGPAKVFCRHRPEGPYPDGMKPTADHLRRLGLTAGIWFMPFAGDRQDPFFADKQDWFVHTPAGEPYVSRWGGTSMDMTHPKARAYLADLARRIANEWGYTYFKMDGLYTGIAVEQLYVHNPYKPDDLGEAVYHRPEVTPVEAYRSGLRLVREAAGEDVFILGCNVSQNMRTMGASFGLVDAMRVGPDNGPGLKSLRRGPWHGSNRYFLHGRVWYNDPDPVYVRTGMPIDHARLICSWAAVTGQLTVASDWLPGLPPDRLNILRRAWPNHHLLPRPVDLFEQDLPRVWHLAWECGGARRDVVGLFNWDGGAAAKFTLPADRIGLAKADRYVGFDYWADRFLEPFGGTLEAEVPPGACRVLAVRPAADHPQVVSTSRHITQGVVDLAEEGWDAGARTLSGTIRVVAGDPYEVRIVAGAGEKAWKAGKAELLGAPAGATVSVARDGPHVRVTVTSPESGEVRWQVRFAK